MFDEHGCPERTVNLKKLQANIDEELHDALRILAISKKTTIRGIIEQLITAEINRNAKAKARAEVITEIVD